MKLDQTFMHFLLEHQNRNKRTLNFVILMESIITAARAIQSEYLNAAVNNLNHDHSTFLNSSGDSVKSLDVLAEKILLHYLRESGQVLQVISEETSEPIHLNADGRYIIYMDPLDGSSNIKSSQSVGIMFGIAKRNLNGAEDFHLRKGSNLIAAGMFIIPSGVFLFSLKDAGTWKFLFDQSGNCSRPTRYILPTDQLKFELSWNVSNTEYYSQKIKDFLIFNKSNFGFRYTGSFAVDIHRLLCNGGVFLYPSIIGHSDSKKNQPNGKLRLLYEANVAAFIIEQAGGIAINENGQRILELQPEDPHERTSIIVGNKEVLEGF